MKRHLIVFAAAISTLTLISTGSGPSASYALKLGDLLNKIEKETRPQQEQAPAKPESAPKPADTAGDGAATGGGGLIGLGESLGVIDKKTSKILQQSTQALEAMQPIGYEEEKTIGSSLALEVFNRFGGPYENPQLQRYITLVGQAVADASDRSDTAYYFAILNTDAPNAFATPGGYIFVSVGLLRLLQNEAQLAGVLGHEIAHIAKKHALQTIQRGKTLQGVGALTMTAMNKDATQFGKVMDEVSNIIFTHGLDKNLEYEADKFGAEYAARTGYYDAGLKDFLRILGTNKSAGGSIFFSTHPAPQDRFKELLKQLTDMPVSKNNNMLADRFLAETKGRL